MSGENRSEIRILFGDTGQGGRSLYRQALMGAGYSHLREFDTLEGFTDLLAVAHPDLVFMDAAMPGGDAIATIADLRHGRLGINPYLPVILTSWEAGQALVRRVIDAGVDDLLIKPLSIRIILDRIESVALHRKPFVVTSDYIGPDRRKAAERRNNTVPLIEVPNPLREKMLGQTLDPKMLQQQIMEANAQINQQRLHASAFRIAFVAAQIVPRYKAQEAPDEATLTLLNDLIVSAEDIRKRIAGTDLDHVAALCDHLLVPVRQMAERGLDFTFTPDWQKSFDLVSSLGDAVLAFFNPDKDASVLAHEVTNAVDRFRARQAVRSGAAENPEPA